MKKITISFIAALLCMFISGKTFAQGSSMIGIYSGYGKTLYTMKDYSPAGFAPIGIRGAIGSRGLQLGADFCSNIMKPKFELGDSTAKTEVTIKDKYLGLMFRAHMGDDQQALAVILRLGAGYWFSSSTTHSSIAGVPDGSYKYKNSFGANAALGFSIPLFESGVHINIEGQFNYNPRKDLGTKEMYNSWVVQAGVSYNFFSRYNLGHY